MRRRRRVPHAARAATAHRPAGGAGAAHRGPHARARHRARRRPRIARAAPTQGRRDVRPVQRHVKVCGSTFRRTARTCSRRDRGWRRIRRRFAALSTASSSCGRSSARGRLTPLRGILCVGRPRQRRGSASNPPLDAFEGHTGEVFARARRRHQQLVKVWSVAGKQPLTFCGHGASVLWRVVDASRSCSSGASACGRSARIIVRAGPGVHLLPKPVPPQTVVGRLEIVHAEARGELAVGSTATRGCQLVAVRVGRTPDCGGTRGERSRRP